MYTHIVMWKFGSDVSDSNKSKMISLLTNLKSTIPELIEVEVNLNTSDSDFSYDIILNTKFNSFDEYKIYSNNNKHKEVVKFISSITEEKAVIDFLDYKGKMIDKQLVVALDVANKNELLKVLDVLPDTISWYKIGLELFIAEGPKILNILKKLNKSIFLDLKLHDIPQTVENALNVACDYDVDMMTVHGLGGKAMLEAASNIASRSKSSPKLVAVTTLTSLSDKDLNEIGLLEVFQIKLSHWIHLLYRLVLMD